jgi:hypothetical protein
MQKANGASIVGCTERVVPSEKEKINWLSEVHSVEKTLFFNQIGSCADI